MSNQPYSGRFQNRNDVDNYEVSEYAPDSYSSYIWQLQKPILSDIIRRYKSQTEPTRLLDFACGTGRILASVADKVEIIEGVDIAESMAQVAQEKSPNAHISVGNILTDPALAAGDFHIVTAFRFFLNTEPDMRVQVLKELRKRLTKKNGVLIPVFDGQVLLNHGR